MRDRRVAVQYVADDGVNGLAVLGEIGMKAGEH